jgi:hypothetical protein
MELRILKKEEVPNKLYGLGIKKDTDVYGLFTKKNELIGLYFLYNDFTDKEAKYVYMEVLNKTYARTIFEYINVFMDLFPNEVLRGKVLKKEVSDMFEIVKTNVTKLEIKDEINKSAVFYERKK